METDETEKPFCWCVVANVTREPHPEGPDGEMRLGLKHFSPGAKLYCCPTYWGDGGAKLRVFGRHRGTAKMVEMVVATRFLTDWRVKAIYDPSVIRLLDGWWSCSEADRQAAEKMAERFRQRVCTRTIGESAAD